MLVLSACSPSDVLGTRETETGSTLSAGTAHSRTLTQQLETDTDAFTAILRERGIDALASNVAVDPALHRPVRTIRVGEESLLLVSYESTQAAATDARRILTLGNDLSSLGLPPDRLQVYQRGRMVVLAAEPAEQLRRALLDIFGNPLE